jgi:hypothetical protein
MGARGYVVKTDAGSELREAVGAVLQGEQFIGSRFAGQRFMHCQAVVVELGVLLMKQLCRISSNLGSVP